MKWYLAKLENGYVVTKTHWITPEEEKKIQVHANLARVDKADIQN